MFMFGSSPPSLSGSASSPKNKVAMQTLKSRAWSCSEGGLCLAAVIFGFRKESSRALLTFGISLSSSLIISKA